MLFVRRICSFVFTVYLAYIAALYLFQERLIFLSDPVDPKHTYQFTYPTEDIWLANGDARLHGVLFKHNSAGNKRGVVLYFKGNMGNVGQSERLASLFLRRGYDVVSMDYRGSGKSRGPMSEDQLLSDSELWFDWAASRYGKSVRVVGYSLGTTFASHVAAMKEVSHTVLFAPMRSVIDVAKERYPIIPEFIARYPFRNYEKLKRAKGQVAIYHGTDDRVIPYASGASLKKVLGSDDSFMAVEGGNHYNIAMKQEVQQDIFQKWE